ncbi:MAG: hydroxymethylbilane synthase [Spirochaetes bacterium]|nr:hydroxymethylbilane synthase [Spirochaetota bacterium]
MIRIGTRGSDLALWQANHIANLIGKDKTEIVIIKTRGDKIQNVSFDKMEGKGFFTKELEDSLLEKKIDLAVHSMKDLPTEDIPGLKIAAVTEREDPSDILLIRPECYNPGGNIPLFDGATLGTSSLRRIAQIKHALISLNAVNLRGNLPTRIKRLRERKYDAIIVANAGVKRLKLDLFDLKVFHLPYSFFLPAASQGALALQIRETDANLEDLLKKFNHADTEKSVMAERSFLKHFGGGCHVPLGALAHVTGSEIHLSGVIASVDGTRLLRESAKGSDPVKLGERLAAIFKEKGADKYI